MCSAQGGFAANDNRCTWQSCQFHIVWVIDRNLSRGSLKGYAAYQTIVIYQVACIAVGGFHSTMGRGWSWKRDISVIDRTHNYRALQKRHAATLSRFANETHVAT